MVSNNFTQQQENTASNQFQMFQQTAQCFLNTVCTRVHVCVRVKARLPEGAEVPGQERVVDVSADPSPSSTWKGAQLVPLGQEQPLHHVWEEGQWTLLAPQG